MEALQTIREIDDEITQTVQVFKEQLGIRCKSGPSPQEREKSF
jgi:hypothetical protein